VLQTTSKWCAQKTIVAGQRLDSKFEGKVYELLLQSRSVIDINVHHSLNLLPPSTLYPSGKKWKVDFEVIGNNNVIYIEVKGRITLELYWQLTVLECLRPDLYSRLLLVFEKRSDFEKTMLKQLETMKVTFNGVSIPKVVTYDKLMSQLIKGEKWA
jgi:hypothetical protein